MPYTYARGGLLTLINKKKYTYPGNINKIPTPTETSPYLQKIEINNRPLQSWITPHHIALLLQQEPYNLS